MARDLMMDSCRKIRRRMNARLVKAYRKGRLAEELGVIEREAKEWLANGRATPRKRAKRA